MASAALYQPSVRPLPLPEVPAGDPRSADELCDDLMMHMLDCDLCLDPAEPVCPTCQGMQARIAQLGGPTQGVVFAV